MPASLKQDKKQPSRLTLPINDDDRFIIPQGRGTSQANYAIGRTVPVSFAAPRTRVRTEAALPATLIKPCNSENTLDECGCCYDASPIVVSLRGSGYRFSSARDGVMFDINGLGRVLWIAWPVAADDAWLALDRNGNGAIDNGGELFGNVTRLRTGKAAANGYEALAEYDDNADGIIDRRDAVYAALLLWTDANRDGKSQPSELHSLASSDVASIGTSYRSSQKTDQYGNNFRLRSTVTFNGGATRFSYDVYPVAAPVAGLTAVTLGHCPAATSPRATTDASQQ